QTDAWLRSRRCRADRCRNTHIVASPHYPRQRHAAKHQPARALSGGRRGWLRGRHSLRGCRRHQNRRSRRAINTGRRTASAHGASMNRDDVKKLQQKKYRQQFGCFLVEGEHLVLELEKAAQQDEQWQRSELFVTATYEHWRSPFKTHVIGERQMMQIADTKTPPGIVGLVPMPARGAAAASNSGERAIDLHEI